jgi:protein O-GlcNAc transferase
MATAGSTPDPLLERAMILHRAGQRAEAEPLYRQAVARHATDARYHYLLGLCLLELGRLPAGIDAMAEAVRLAPQHAGANYALGRALAGEPGVEARAAQHLAVAIQRAPTMVEAYLELANLLARTDRLKAALDCLRAGLTQVPDHPGLAANYANLLYQAGRREEAVALWRRALERQPNLAAARAGLGIDRRNRGDLAGAEEEFRRAVAAWPRNAECRFNLGATLRHRGNLAGAIDELKRALAIDPEFVRAELELARCYQSVCAWDELAKLAPALEREFAAAEAGGPARLSPFFALSLDTTEARRLAVARARAEQTRARAALEWQGPPIAHSATLRDRIRIGYLSSDFRDHAVGHLFADLFRHHDRARFAVSAYSIGPDDASAYRAKFEAGFERFVDLRAESDAAAAQRIHADSTDILVDMNGATALARFEIAAMRPAPVQVNYVGFPGSTGASFIDYLLTDRVVSPPGTEASYSESLCYLPGCYMPSPAWPPERGAPTDRAAEGLPEDGFVFCCFCAHHKIERASFERWMALLKRVPRSVLWLLGGSPESEWRLLDAAEAAGVYSRRVVFATRRAKSDHLARLALADLMLDTFTYGGHTTVSDALAVGVPVVSRRGDSLAGRVGASMLTAIGLPELVAETSEAYEAIAGRLAAEPAELAAVKAKLDANLPTASPFDPKRLARDLERGYSEMWRRRVAGEPAGTIDVAALPG